jgi:hypothetical protein
MVVAAALVVGGVSGLRALSGPSVQVGHTPTPSVATLPNPSSSPTTPQLTHDWCSPGTLGASYRKLPGPTEFGSIVLTNSGRTKCSLGGVPIVALLDDSGVAYEVTIQEIDPFWKTEGSSAPRAWPEVRLAPGASARIRVAVTNWCNTGPASWRLAFPGQGTIGIDHLPGLPYLQCVNPASPATVQVGPVEPVA